MANNNDNRFYLNINNERPAYNDRAYPTTPSTFPNPIFPSQGQQAQQQQQTQQNPNQQYGNQFAPAGYFQNQQYPANYPQQPPTTYQPSPHAVPQQQTTYQPRVSPNQADATNGLVHQFSHQNLGGASRQQQQQHYSSRPGGGGSQRPRTAGTQGQQHSYNSYLNAPMPSHPSQQRNWAEFDSAPERNPNKYGQAVTVQQKSAINLAETFFKDNVQRARDRNVRQNEMEKRLADPNQTSARRDQVWSNAGRVEGKYLRFLRTREKPENYATLKIIGKGAFGEVKLVQKKADGKIYAMKSLVKSEMFKKDQLAHVRAERDILAESDSPWVVKLYNTFQDYDFLYMLMEFLPGGDLMTMLIKYEIFSEDITRFYIAEIVLAIEAVHNYGFIHRDIKPDNILLDRGGHVKLTDFGLSTGFHKLHDNTYYQKLLSKNTTSSKARDRNSVSLDQINLTVSNRGVINDWRKSRRVMAYSTVGTPDYIAPEIFTGAGYGNDCDWWSLGTIMFECQVGWPPFCAEDAHDTYRKIVNWRQSLYFPEDIQLGPEAENLIRSLVCNTENRLGRGGAAEIKNHKFFRGVEFDTLRRIRAPFEPKLSSNIDTTYFPTDEIDQTDNATVLKAQNAGQPKDYQPEMSLPFIGYTFKRFEQYSR